MQAQTTQAQPPPPLPALKQLIDELAENGTAFEGKAGLSGSRKSCSCFARARILRCSCCGRMCVISSTAWSGCSNSSTGCYNRHFVWLRPHLQSCRVGCANDDAVMYYSEGLYMAQRRFASCNAPDPDEVMQVCVDASDFLDPDSPVGHKYEAERQAGWTYIPLLLLYNLYIKEIRTCKPICSACHDHNFMVPCCLRVLALFCTLHHLAVMQLSVPPGFLLASAGILMMAVYTLVSYYRFTGLIYCFSSYCRRGSILNFKLQTASAFVMQCQKFLFVILVCFTLHATSLSCFTQASTTVASQLATRAMNTSY